jgi:hypothetical protein
MVGYVWIQEVERFDVRSRQIREGLSDRPEALGNEAPGRSSIECSIDLEGGNPVGLVKTSANSLRRGAISGGAD